MLLLPLLLLAVNATPWKMAELKKTPQSWQAPTEEAGVKAVWIAGPVYKGKPTRAFAYYAAPAGITKAPGMVLLHGGGGTAFAEWARMWNARGFAAIAIDTVGTLPSKADTAKLWDPKRTRHDHSGPAGWGDFSNIDTPIEDQWTYHAVALSVAAHSFLRAQPGVDSGHIGVTGISWGGYLTSIVVSVDSRFRFGIPVYGCGYLGEDSAWLGEFKKLGPERTARWLKLWDPSSYLQQARRPMFWINGTNDFAYVMPSWQKSYRLPPAKRQLSLQVRMKHSHPDGAKPEEIFSYASGKRMKIRKQGIHGQEAWLDYAKDLKPVKAELCFTKDTGRWQDRKWETIVARIEGHRALGTIPSGATVAYLNLVDGAGLIVSGEHLELTR